MSDNVKSAHRNAISVWEDEGGASLSIGGRVNAIVREKADGRLSERARLDRTHDSDARGEHRYPDLHQTGAEQKARQERDDLKRALARLR